MANDGLKPIRIALDAMGGDYGPSIVIPGAAIAINKNPKIEFIFFGNREKIEYELKQFPNLLECSTIKHTDFAVGMDDKPSQALRQGRYKSSMWQAIEAVKNGEADACISAGNTGALMAMSRFCLKMISGIERPALACRWPTIKGETIVLDVGASIGAEAETLVEMALMGSAMARVLFDIEKPKIGLLNVGVEEIKGLDSIKEAARRLRSLNIPNLDYHGFIEGDDLGKGTTDVVVTEGFAGNIALKTAEGTAKQIGTYLKDAIGDSLLSKIGYLMMRVAFQNLKKKMDPRVVNGAVFLGLDGIVVKSHGGTDATGFASAIKVAYDTARNELLTKITKAIKIMEDSDSEVSHTKKAEGE